MDHLARSFLHLVALPFRTRASMQLEILALRQQLATYKQSGARPRIRPVDRLFWAWLSKVWAHWREVVVFVQPRTVVAWQRRRFREHWTRLSGKTRPGRPRVSPDVRQLIRRMSRANPTWGSPRIAGELGKLGIDVAKSTVESYMVRRRQPPSPTWRAFLTNHVGDLVSIDFFVVPTVRFKVLFVLIVLAHHRRRIVHFGVTQHPTAQWTAQQIVNAFPWDEAPRYVRRDRDAVYGEAFRRRVRNMGIREVIIAPQSPWQNAFAERLIGSIRRECLDHVIVLSEHHLTRLLRSYVAYYHRWRTHLSLAMDCPNHRTVQTQEQGDVIEVAEVGALHQHYERRAA